MLPVAAARRPLYGGSLRVEMRARVASLDPREWPTDPAEAAATEKVASLVFDRFVRLDGNGRVQPALAMSWEHDAEFKRWQFRLRPNVKFHDGTALTPSVVAGDWQRLYGTDRLATASAEWLVIQSEKPMPDLLAEFASGRNFVLHVAADSSIVGTGPFRVTEWQPRQRLVLAANDDHWGGRPFVDSISIEMGVTPQTQLVDFQLGKADIIELTPDLVRRTAQVGARIWSSAPVELLALVFQPDRPAVQDVRLRQAIALSIDRGAIWTVLVQKQGEVAGGLLPQWLSGYAFLFPTEAQLERARQLRGELPSAAAGGLTPLKLVYDATDPLARTVAERIAVNARDAGIAIQVVPSGPASAAAYDARLVRLRLGITDPRAALSTIATAVGEKLELRPDAAATPEQLYAAERALLETFRVVPMAHLPETYGLSARVKDWMPPRWGGWRLEDVWLDTASPIAAGEKR